MGLDEAQLFGFDPVDRGLLPRLLLTGGALHGFDAGEHVSPNLLTSLGTELDRAVVLDHRVLDGLDRHPTLPTCALVMLAADAVEVLVDLALRVFVKIRRLPHEPQKTVPLSQ